MTFWTTQVVDHLWASGLKLGRGGLRCFKWSRLWFPRRRKTSYNKKKLRATRNGSIHVMSTTTGYAWDIFSFAGILVLRECLETFRGLPFLHFFLRILVLRVCLGHLQFCGNAWETFRNNVTFLLSFLAFLFFSFFHSWEVPFIALEAIYFYVDGTAASPSSAHGFGDGCSFWRTRYL